MDDVWNLTIGEIVGPFGRVGEVKVRIETDFPDRFARLREVCLVDSSGAARLMPIERARLHKGQALVKLRGVDSIDAAEMLRGSMVRVRAADAVRLPDNEFFIHDLIGCEVVTDAGASLGSLTQVLRGPANDVYVVGSGKSEVLLPAIKEVVQNVDIPNRRITVTPTPGLIDAAEEVR